MRDLVTGDGCRVLIIDDTDAIHRDFRKILCPKKTPTCVSRDDHQTLFEDEARPADPWIEFQVDSARQGAEGVALVKRALEEERPYALAFVDVRMPPGWDGIETIERLWMADPRIQCVICTAYSDYSFCEILERLGRNDRLLILKKPFDTAEVALMASSLFKKWCLNRQMETELRDLYEQARDLQNSESALRTYGSELERVLVAHTASIEATRDVAVFALAKLADSRDPETGEHLVRMREYSQILAETLAVEGPYTSQIDDVFLQDLYRSSPLHDVGKVGIPDAILLKPGRLTEQEFATMTGHAEIGAETLDETARSCPDGGFFLMAARIARHHHERWNGSGYPDGLKGLDIPLEARIVALADVFDALTSRRAYKAAFPVENARQIILEGCGSHFDPVIVEAFLNCYPQFVEIVNGTRLPQRTTPTLSAETVRRRLRDRIRTTFASEDNGVLIVHRDAEFSRRVSSWLEEANYSVRTTHDVDQAIQEIQRLAPQYILADWKIEGLDGHDLFGWVRQERMAHYVYTIAVAEESERAAARQALNIGADDFVSENLAQEELLARLRAARRVLCLENRLRQIATNDPLTGIATRPFIEAQILREWHRADRYHSPISCAVMDIDGFTALVEKYGRAAGDQVLKSAAAALVENSRASDFLCRLTGDCFLFVFVECNEQEATFCAERFRTAMLSQVHQFNGEQVRVTASFGIAQRGRETATLDELIGCALQALRVAKLSGRNRTVQYRNTSLDHASASFLGHEHRPLSELRAKDVMTTPIYCLRETTTANQAVCFLLRYRLNSIPVVNRHGELTGVLSEEDLLREVNWAARGETPIGDLARADVNCFEEQDSARDVWEFLKTAPVRRVVVAKEGRPTGIISRATLLRWISCDESKAARSNRLCDIPDDNVVESTSSGQLTLR